jgi:hypothetical protein
VKEGGKGEKCKRVKGGQRSVRQRLFIKVSLRTARAKDVGRRRKDSTVKTY